VTRRASTSLRARAESGDRLIGALLRMPGEELVEMVAIAGYDFVLVDCEHGPADLIALRQHIAVAQLHSTPVIVRIGEGDHGMVLRALDQGAQGIVAPHLDSAADAAALVAATHYPPLGQRGFATYSRVGRFGEIDPSHHREWFLANTLLIGMIESPHGVAAAADIIRTPGIDGIMIGPADLAASSSAHDLPVQVAAAQVNAQLVEAGRLRMDIVNTAAAASGAFADGAQLVVYNLTHVLMEHLRRGIIPRP